jgi:four helix bundle protein
MESPSRIRSYRDLKVWQLGMEIVEAVYQLSSSYPKDETYGLTSQIRRAAVSVPANIAEGHARAFTKEYQRHLSIAVGSLAEVETYLELCVRLGYCRVDSVGAVQKMTDEERRMLRGLQRALRAKNHDLP